MGEAIGAVLAYGVGVGVSPVPIIATVLILFTPRARVNGPVFLAGWVTGLTAVTAAVVAVASALGVGTDPAADDGVSWLRVVAGVALLALAVRTWRGRTRPGEEPELPAWMARLDDLTPTGALRLALVLSANPKNLLLALGAGATLAQLGPTAAEAVVAVAVFVALGSAAVALAVLYAVVGGERARRGLDEAKSWLVVHNSAVMAVVLLVFSAVLVSRGLGG